MDEGKKILVNGSYLTLKHYKEPLKKVEIENGFGFYGALLSTLDGKSVMCHICGKLFGALHAHVQQAHKMHPKEYRNKFQLARQTALLSEEERLKRKERTLYWMNKKTSAEKRKMKQKALKRYREWKRNNYNVNNFTIRLETKNKRGTCPDQLLEKIKEVSKKIGRVPTKRDFIEETNTQRYLHLIYKTFGSWAKALIMVGMTPRSTQNNSKRRQYNDDELLEYLIIYKQEEGKIPTSTDCRRSIIPSEEVYRRHFGSLPNARRLAGIEEMPTRWGTK